MELVFEKFGLPVDETKNISLNIKSQIPVGKGMASSTADIGATIKATLSMLNKTLTGEEISKLAVKIEATDSTRKIGLYQRTSIRRKSCRNDW